MKRLLVAGAGPIFQLARVWRDFEGSRTHLGEFTMLEWYRPGAGLAALMDETEALLRATLPPPFWQDGFERITVADAFHRWAGADVLATEGDAAGLAREAGAVLRDGEEMGRSVLPPAAGADRAATRARPAELPDALAGVASGAGATGSGRPARGAAVRAFRRRDGTRERVRGADRRPGASGAVSTPIGPGGTRSTARPGRATTISWQRSGTACRRPRGSRSDSIGSPCWRQGRPGSSRCCGCRARTSFVSRNLAGKPA